MAPGNTKRKTLQEGIREKSAKFYKQWTLQNGDFTLGLLLNQCVHHWPTTATELTKTEQKQQTSIT